MAQNKQPNPNASESLKVGESESVTIGCRHNYPDLCKNNNATSICAFPRKDGKCLAPPSSWKRLYPNLLKIKIIDKPD